MKRNKVISDIRKGKGSQLATAAVAVHVDVIGGIKNGCKLGYDINPSRVYLLRFLDDTLIDLEASYV